MLPLHLQVPLLLRGALYAEVLVHGWRCRLPGFIKETQTEAHTQTSLYSHQIHAVHGALKIRPYRISFDQEASPTAASPGEEKTIVSRAFPAAGGTSASQQRCAARKKGGRARRSPARGAASFPGGAAFSCQRCPYLVLVPTPRTATNDRAALKGWDPAVGYSPTTRAASSNDLIAKA